MKLLYCVLFGVLSGVAGKFEYFPPKYHFEVFDKEEWVEPFALLSEETSEFHVIITGYNNKSTDTNIQYLTLGSDVETWTDHGYIPENREAGLEARSFTNYLAYDAQGTGKVILATYKDDQLNLFNYPKINLGDRYEKSCTNCGVYDENRSPAYWVTPSWCNNLKKFVSLNYTHLISSSDLIDWTQGSVPLGACLENSEEKKIFVEEIFFIRHPTIEKQVAVAIARDYWAFHTFYYFLDFSETGILVDCYDKLTFDFGSDFTENAVANSYKILPKEIYMLGMVSNIYTFVPEDEYYPAPTLISAYPRSISLKFLDGALRLNILPFAGKPSSGKSKVREIVIKDKTFRRDENLLEGYESKSFKIKAIMSSANATEYGLNLLDNDKTAAYVYWWGPASTVCLDRSETELPKTTNPNAKFYYYYSEFCSPAYLTLKGLAVWIFVDGLVTEVFDVNGWFTMTAIVYSDERAKRLSTYTVDRQVSVDELSLQLYDE